MFIYPSQFDSSQQINQNNWAVTMVCAQKGNHAMLIIEGVNEIGKTFTKRAHLMGPYTSSEQNKGMVRGFNCYFGFGKIGRVAVEDKTDKKIYFSVKSETWIRSAEKVNTLLTAAENEEKNQLANPRAFNIFGRKSIFASNVETFQIDDPVLQEVYKSEPDLLTKVRDEADAYESSTRKYFELMDLNKRGYSGSKYFYVRTITNTLIDITAGIKTLHNNFIRNNGALELNSF